MTVKKTITTVYLLVTFVILFSAYQLNKSNLPQSTKTSVLEGERTNLPTSLFMYRLLEDYSAKYNIPKHVIYNVAFLETGYRGPFHVGYNPSQKSYAGAVGPMQIITKYSHTYAGRRVRESELRNDLRLNIEISCKMLRKLYKMYGRWDLALGYYNTGYPQVNEYARYASKTYNYESKWVRPSITYSSL